MIKKSLRSLLAIVMFFTMASSLVFASETAGLCDMPNNWSTTALNNVVSNGLLMGNDGKVMPNENLTRAQMAIVINRAFGTRSKADLSSYTDVIAGAWYYDDMAKAVQMKTFMGSGSKLNPNENITREEAFVVIARAFKLSGAAESILDKFSDKNSLSQWAKDGGASLVAAGYVTGANGKISPKQYITRAEFAQIMDNLLKNYIKTAGTYTTDLNGNVMVNVPNVTLKNIKITGDLIIGDGVGNGDVTLDGVTVTGRTVIRGGGVNSIKIFGKSKIQNIIIARVDGQVRVYSQDGTEIGTVIVDGEDNVIIEGNVGAVTVVAPDVTVTATKADITAATIKGENSKLIVGTNSNINTVTVDGKNTTITASSGSKIKDIVVNRDGVKIDGSGEVEMVKATANNVSVTTPKTSVTAATGTTGVTAGAKNVAGGSTGSVISESKETGTSGSSGGHHSSEANTVPTFSSVTIIGIAQERRILTAAGVGYADAELDLAGSPAYQWMICTIADGVYTDITGATSATYTPQSNDVDKYIKVKVTPVALTGSSPGKPILSMATEAIGSAPYISITDDGNITEGAENGEKIIVTLNDGQFVDTLNVANWSVAYLPTGVKVGSIVRDSDTQATITLSGNRTTDYDLNITKLFVRCGGAEIMGAYSTSIVSKPLGVTFTAINPILTIEEPTYQAPYGNMGINKKLIAFKASSAPYNSTVNILVWRMGGWTVNFNNFKVYIDLNDDGSADTNEQLTFDGAGGTINNGDNIDIVYQNQGKSSAKALLSGIKLTPELMIHDIMIMGDMDSGVQLGVGWINKSKVENTSAYLTSDTVENVTVLNLIYIPL